jgi:signal transduction histidine kinase
VTGVAAGTITAMPSRPTRAAVACTIAAAAGAVLLAGAGEAVSLWARRADASTVSLAIAVLLVTGTGAVLVLARADNRVGWVMAAAGAAWGLGMGVFDAGIRGVLTLPGTVPAADTLVLAGAPVRGLGWLAAAIGVPVLFPAGRLPGPRWRWLGWLLVVTMVTSVAGLALDRSVQNDQLRAAGWHSAVPASLAGLADILGTLSLLLMAITVVGSVAALVVRFRHGDVPLRRQLLLFAAAAALPVVIIPTAFGAGWPSWVFALSVAPLPVAVAVAILSGGLFDLATVANRALVWSVLSASIAGLYAIVVAGTGELLGHAGARWLPWLGAAVAAVSFAPLRATLQGAANRITYGGWGRPYDVLAGLSPRIESAIDGDALLADVVGQLSGTLGLSAVALRNASGQVLAGMPGSSAVVLPLHAYGTRAGDLLYTEPATPLRAADRRVLDDLAAQLALLLHARALTDDVRRARERLVLAREEERRRLRSDLHDGLGPALAGLMLKVDNARALVPSQPQTAADDLLLLRDDIQATVVDVRRLVEGLRPPALDELGLAAALTQAVHRLASPTVTHLDVKLDDELPAAVEVAVYRIVSEAVTNAARHAGATMCAIKVNRDGATLTATVSDDGSGIAAGTAGGNGLFTMRERAEELGGTLSVQTSPDGTSVTARIPLTAGPLRSTRDD